MTEDWVGRTLNDRYQILEVLGSGGMSTVYKASDPNLNRVVAIKMIHPHLAAMDDFRARFRDEATAVAQLRHPNIVQVFDFEATAELAYIVFEFVAGETLQDRLARLAASDRKMPMPEVVEFSSQIADALDYAHARGLVHRDVKPANVLLDVHGQAFLTDFGIVKIADGIQHTATGAVVGTARYMAPEQIRGTTLDARTDLYSLGVTMFEMASGKPPYVADSAMTLMMMHVNDPVPNATAEGIPEPLGSVIERALAKDPDERYPSCGDLREVLAQMDLSQPAPAAMAPSAPDPGAAPVPAPAVGPAPADPRSDGDGLAPVTGEGAGGRVGGRYALLGSLALLVVAVVAGATLALRPGGDPETDTGADTEAASDAAPTTTSTAPSTTASAISTTPTTAASTVTEPPAYPETVTITYIYLSGGRYVVEYETDGYTESLPGDHVHFYWNTTYENEAGAGPNADDWYVWGGPRPFDAYTEGDRPEGATAMCAVVANPDHTIKPGTGNCIDLP